MRIALLIGLVVIAVGATASADAVDPQVPQLKKQVRDLRSDKADLQAVIRDLRSDKADLNDQIDAQDDLIGNQADTITRLRARDPLDAVTARDADGLWQAMRAIWLAFPRLPEGALCGYDKSLVPADPDGYTLTSYTFLRFTGC
jgi:hypothetical protein